MNFLAKIKLSNNYDLIDTGTPPITDVEGTTALLTDDGTSWEFLEGSWQQIDIPTDMVIKHSIYPFLSSICNSIGNTFANCEFSAFYEQAIIGIDEDNNYTISSLEVAPKVQAGDFVLINTSIDSVLTQVISSD